MSTNAASSSYQAGIGRAGRFGYAAMLMFGGTFAVWSATASISGAVIAPAQVVADSNVKKVQHQVGGVVGELRVREGDRVRAGDVLLKLDDTVPRANLQIIVRQLDEFMARSARLEAERDGADGPVFPPTLASRAGDPAIAGLMTAELRLFQTRLSAREGLRAQLQKRILQLRSEAEGMTEQRTAKLRESDLIQRELTGVRTLFSQNLVQLTRLMQLEREAVSLEGARGQLTAQIAQSEGRIAETELQILQLSEDLRAETMKELREIQGRMSELFERRVAAEDMLKRVELRAPVSGVVHQLGVHTVGGVISPAEPAMLIVPTDDDLFFEARVTPTDFDQVRIGQMVNLRLHAFNQRTTPELQGTVVRVGADVVREQQTGLSFYLIRIGVPKKELEKITPHQIFAGMQADAYLKTEDRTALDFLIRPINDHLHKAFRER